MAFYHVGSCNCPVGCCDCGPVNWENEYRLIKGKYEALKDQYDKEVKSEYKFIKEDIDKYSKSVLAKAHKDSVEILDKAYKTQGLIKSFNSTLSKHKLARILWNMLEFDNYRDFKNYLYNVLKD